MRLSRMNDARRHRFKFFALGNELSSLAKTEHFEFRSSLNIRQEL